MAASSSSAGAPAPLFGLGGAASSSSAPPVAAGFAAISHSIWLEKYRPTTLEEIVGNEGFIQQMKVIRQDPSRMTNFMLCGPPGVGKTTCIHALAKEILGPE